jgi:hypothetical protein
MKVIFNGFSSYPRVLYNETMKCHRRREEKVTVISRVRNVTFGSTLGLSYKQVIALRDVCNTRVYTNLRARNVVRTDMARSGNLKKIVRIGHGCCEFFVNTRGCRHTRFNLYCFPFDRIVTPCFFSRMREVFYTKTARTWLRGRKRTRKKTLSCPCACAAVVNHEVKKNLI